MKNGHAGTLCGDLIYVSGGQKFDGHCRNMFSYNPTQDMWKEEPGMIHPRSNHVMVAVSERLYVIGGNTEDPYGFPVSCTSIEIYSPTTRTWSLTQAEFNIREAGAFVLNDNIYIVGGINGQHYFSDLIQRYITSRDSVDLVDKFPTRIYGRACCVLTLPQYIC